MKRIFPLLLAALLLFAACTAETSDNGTVPDKTTEEPVENGGSDATGENPGETEEPAALDAPIKVGVMKGPTAMGMVKLIKDSENGEAGQEYEFSLDVIDSIIPKISAGTLDIAAVPANISSVLYNNTEGKVKVLAINTLGVLYVVEKGESITSAADLAGRTIYATGKGAVPEYALRYILSENGIDPDTDITIEYKSEAAEILPLLAQSDDGIAILPQPFATAALGNVEGLRTALDWTEEWDKVAGGSSSMVTGVIVVRTEFLENHPEAVAAFLREYEASTAYVNNNPAEAAPWIEEYGIVAAAVAEKAIPKCHITCITGEEMKSMLTGYLTVLFDENPQSVGGSIPDEVFFTILEK